MTVSTPVGQMSATNPQRVGTLFLQMALDRKRAGQKLAELRDQKRLTQKALEEASGVDRRSIQRWEGGNTLPRWNNLDAIAEVLGNEVYEIFRAVGVQPEDSPAKTPNLVDSLHGPVAEKMREQLDRIEKKLDELLKQRGAAKKTQRRLQEPTRKAGRPKPQSR